MPGNKAQALAKAEAQELTGTEPGEAECTCVRQNPSMNALNPKPSHNLCGSEGLNSLIHSKPNPMSSLSMIAAIAADTTTCLVLFARPSGSSGACATAGCRFHDPQLSKTPMLHSSVSIGLQCDYFQPYMALLSTVDNSKRNIAP